MSRQKKGSVGGCNFTVNPIGDERFEIHAWYYNDVVEVRGRAGS